MPAKGQKIPLAERFWSKVDKRGPDECWPWLGAKIRGYGQILYDNHKMIYAHRAAMLLAGRLKPPELDVLHNCNNPSCVNERHLRMGTHRENMQDAIRAGTFSFVTPLKGEDNPRAKLKDSDVLLIREMAAAGFSHTKISKQFPVSRELISRILRQELWGHI